MAITLKNAYKLNGTPDLPSFVVLQNECNNVSYFSDDNPINWLTSWEGYWYYQGYMIGLDVIGDDLPPSGGTAIVEFVVSYWDENGQNFVDGISPIIETSVGTVGNITATNIDGYGQAEIIIPSLGDNIIDNIDIEVKVLYDTIESSISFSQKGNYVISEETIDSVISYGSVIPGNITSGYIPASGGSATTYIDDGTQSWTSSDEILRVTYASGTIVDTVTKHGDFGTYNIAPTQYELTADAASKETVESGITSVSSITIYWISNYNNNSISETAYVYQNANQIENESSEEEYRTTTSSNGCSDVGTRSVAADTEYQYDEEITTSTESDYTYTYGDIQDASISVYPTIFTSDGGSGTITLGDAYYERKSTRKTRTVTTTQPIRRSRTVYNEQIRYRYADKTNYQSRSRYLYTWTSGSQSYSDWGSWSTYDSACGSYGSWSSWETYSTSNGDWGSWRNYGSATNEYGSWVTGSTTTSNISCDYTVSTSTSSVISSCSNSSFMVSSSTSTSSSTGIITASIDCDAGTWTDSVSILRKAYVEPETWGSWSITISGVPSSVTAGSGSTYTITATAKRTSSYGNTETIDSSDIDIECVYGTMSDHGSYYIYTAPNSSFSGSQYADTIKFNYGSDRLATKTVTIL